MSIKIEILRGLVALARSMAKGGDVAKRVFGALLMMQKFDIARIEATVCRKVMRYATCAFFSYEAATVVVSIVYLADY